MDWARRAVLLALLLLWPLQSQASYKLNPLLDDQLDYYVGDVENDLRYLHLDQTTPQTVINGTPVFNAGLTSTGNFTLGSATVTCNPYLYHWGYITAATSQKYVSWLLDDTDDYFKLARQDANILGFKIGMPVDITGAATVSSLLTAAQFNTTTTGVSTTVFYDTDIVAPGSSTYARYFHGGTVFSETASRWIGFNSGASWTGRFIEFDVNNVKKFSVDNAGDVLAISYSIGSDKLTSFANLASLAGLSFASTSFVKMTSAGTFGLDTATYLTTVTAHDLLSATHGDTTASTIARGDLIVGTGATAKWDNLALGTAGKILRSDGTDLKYTTATYPDTGTAFRLPVFSATNVMTELAAVGVTGEYLKGNTGAIPSWATLNQAAVAGLTTTDSPNFANLVITLGGSIRPSGDTATAFGISSQTAPTTNWINFDTLNKVLTVNHNPTKVTHSEKFAVNGNIIMFNTADAAINQGQYLKFSGFYSGSNTATFGQIFGAKESALGDAAGYLAFYTSDGATLTEKMRLISTGELILSKFDITNSAGTYNNHFLASGSQSTNITYTLPAAVGAAGTVLTDAAGNGTLSWAVPGHTPVRGEVPSGTINGTNATFTLAHTPAYGITLFVDGIRLKLTNDYTISGTTITMLNIPQADSNLLADYEY